MEKYIVKENHCKCHPETCCCDSYIIMLGEKKISLNNKEDLEQLVKVANNGLKK